jgi:tRNA pseudouridine55 synthase
MTDGIVNVLKPPGMTSHDVVSRIRRIYGVKKAGHSGTLDPDAAGVLPVFIGSATRLLEYAATGTKQYRAEGLLGIRTDTGDDSGNVLETKLFADFSATEFEKILQQFRGKILQIPPMYSALKVNGKKLYEYARQGIKIERSARPVDIFRLECIRFYPPYFCLDIECSKGTYIRTLLEDIAVSMGTCACMTFLLRTKAGDFSIEDSHTLEEIANASDKVLLPPETAVCKTGRLSVNALQAFRITNGVRTTIKGTASGTYSLYLADSFLGMVSVEEEIVKPEKILLQVSQPPDL